MATAPPETLNGADAAQAQTAVVEPRKNVYCGVCTLPPEYCEFGGTTAECEEWLKSTHPDVHERIYSEEALSANLRLLSTSARESAAKDSSRKAAKAARTAQKTATQRAAAKVYIKRVERNKRKYVTVISGLEKHGLELKKVAKDLGKKFACGSSVTKANPGALAPTGEGEGKEAMVPSGSVEEITVQGDVAEEVREWIEEVFEGAVPEDNLEVVDVGKKKGGG